MNRSTRKIILAPESFQESSLGIILSRAGYEFQIALEQDSFELYAFVVDDYLENIQNIPRLMTTKIPQLSHLEKAFVDVSNLNDDANKVLLQYFSSKYDLDLIDSYSSEFKNLFTLKIQDYLNFGYFIDLIVIEAYKSQFNASLFRSLLNYSFEMLFRLLEKKGSLLPLEVSYAHNEKAFVISLSISINQFKYGEDFNDDQNFYREIMSNCNLVDLTYNERSQKLIMSLVVFKKLSLFRSCFLSIIACRKKESIISRNIQIAKIDDEIKYRPHKGIEKEDLRIEGLPLKFALFASKIFDRDNQKNTHVTVEDLRKIIRDQYPVKEDVEFAEVNEGYYTEALEILYKNDWNEKVIKSISSNDILINSMTVKDFNSVGADENLNIKGEKEQLNEIQKVSGGKLETNDESILVKSQNASSKDIQDYTLVKGNAVGDDENKKSLENFKAEKQEEKNFVAKTKGFEPEDANVKDKIIVKGEGSRENELVQKITDLNPDINSDDRKNLIVHSSENSVDLAHALALKKLKEVEENYSRLMDKNLKTLKLLDHIKKEYLKLKTVNNSVVSKGYSQNNGIEAKQEILSLSKELEELKIQERSLIKSKNDLEKINEAKTLKIGQLEQKMAKFKEEFYRTKEYTNKEKMLELELENKKLADKIELMSRNLLIATNNISSKESSNVVRSEKEIDSLKTMLNATHTIIKKMKEEKVDSEKKLKVEIEQLNRELIESKKLLELKNNNFEKDKLTDSRNQSQFTVEKEMIAGIEERLNEVLNDKKGLEERLKESVLESKKLEHKLKIATAQLDESNKKKYKSDKSTAGQNETYIKQFESANKKLLEVTSDLMDKKKELIKLKNENSGLSTKVHDLERKLLNLDKKIA